MIRNGSFAAMTCVVLVGLLACSAPQTRVETEAVHDYIAAAELAETDRIRFRSMQSPAHKPINEHFAIVEAGNNHYLVEFRQRCFALYDNARITPDVRREGNVIRARFDTIRGCWISKIYAIDAAQALELEQLGDAPGDENDVSTDELLDEAPSKDSAEP